MIVIILQVSYHFITDPNFLAKYGMEEVITSFMGPFGEYMDFIGLENLKGENIVFIFMS